MDNKLILLVGITAGIAGAVYILYQELRKQRTQIKEQNMQIRALLQQAKRVEGLIYTYNIDQIEGIRGRPRSDTRGRMLSSHIFPVDESMRDMIYVWDEDNNLEQSPEKDDAILNHEHSLQRPEDSDEETSNSHSESDSDSTSESSSDDDVAELRRMINPQNTRHRPQNPVNFVAPIQTSIINPNLMQQAQQRLQRIPRMVSSHQQANIINRPQTPAHPPQILNPFSGLIRQHLPIHSQHPQQHQIHSSQPQHQPQPQHQHQPQPQPQIHSSQDHHQDHHQSLPQSQQGGVITSSEPIHTEYNPILDDIKTFDVSSDSSEEEQNETSPLPSLDNIDNKDELKFGNQDRVNLYEQQDMKDEEPLTISLGGIANTSNSSSNITQTSLKIDRPLDELEMIHDEEVDEEVDEEADDSSNPETKKKVRYYKDTPTNRKMKRVGKAY